MFSKIRTKSLLNCLMLLLLGVACWSHATTLQHLSSAASNSVNTIQTPKLKLIPERYKGPCPIDVEAEGILLANETIQMKYRWQYQGTMGEVETILLAKNEPRAVTKSFKNIGKTPQPDRLTLSSKPLADVVSVYGATVQLLALPMDQNDWHGAYISEPVTYRIECDANASGFGMNSLRPKPDLVSGPGFSIAGATAPWGTTLAVDASAFQASKRGNLCALGFAYDVYNRGMADAGVSQALLLKGNVNLNSQQIDILQPERKASVTDTIYLGDGRHLLTLSLDHLAQVDESSESNNAHYITVMVSGCAND